MRRLVLAGIAGALLWALPAGAAVTLPPSFSGSCAFSGPITPKPPITVVPIPGPHFDYAGTGSCSGTLDGAPVSAAPLTLTFTNVPTLFDTCELGPDFDLQGTMTIGTPPGRDLFAITVNLARVALAGPFAVTTEGNGLGVGVGQFSPADASSAPQQCATTGVAAASLSGSFNTISPLVGTRAPQPAARPQGTAHAVGPGPMSAPSGCGAPPPLLPRLPAIRGRRIVAAAIYVDRRLVWRRRGHNLRRARLPAIGASGHEVRIVVWFAGGGRREAVHRYAAGCARR